MKNIVLFDLDGTLCDISHRLHHIKKDKKDWNSFFNECVNDKPKPNIIRIFRAMRECGYEIFITSGRSDIVKEQTEKWLIDNNVIPDELLMRRNGDRRDDAIVKEEWLNGGLLGRKEDIVCVFDDRQRVVDMWRRNGLTCLQVEAWEE